MLKKKVDSSKLRVNPNSPLAAQIVDDKVIDMLLFLTFRYGKNFLAWKAKQIEDIETKVKMATIEEKTNAQSSVTGGVSAT
jgi:hypothetical protein